MPSGNVLVPEEMIKKAKQLSSFLPAEVKQQIKTIENMKRSFSLPAKINGDYVLIVGIVTDSPIRSTIAFDLDDLKIIMEVVLKALDRLGVNRNEFLAQFIQEGESSA
ncbi:hypothetical protein [Acidianus bottle-shaped virus]|uniref:Uncharacterized protein ORF107b n=1 Tax=Acidianus bottle-shaped virus (isolate Italy/Pozzuoli) TaxID=654911 RepID=Y107B_ABVP|nr:hypothetical protein ABV_gp17 [Acidianus bottle-shaped virus]A4ZUA3.1 RecName: Full=Uncharacterized protein ORF107b [Acidianus bottle-shaped virus (isolate Pozzuoli)]ABP73407.1 hypothetical protein [Acidianus bottle-shaped virus]